MIELKSSAVIKLSKSISSNKMFKIINGLIVINNNMRKNHGRLFNLKNINHDLKTLLIILSLIHISLFMVEIIKNKK